MSARVDWQVDGASCASCPGPQATRAALERLDGAELRTAAGDRTGVRLEGAEIPGGESVSEPPPLGAVQITPNGEPFVLLVDRYRTGGYAKPAVVHPDDLPIIAQLLPGMRVTFKLVEPALRWDLAATSRRPRRVSCTSASSVVPAPASAMPMYWCGLSRSRRKTIPATALSVENCPATTAATLTGPRAAAYE